MTSFKIKHGEIGIQTHFLTPIFGLLDPPASRVHSAFFGCLSKFGITTDDVKIGQGVPNLSEASLSYHLLNFNGMVKLSLDKMEVIFFDTTRLSKEQMTDVFDRVSTCLAKFAQDLAIREYSVNISLHGVLEGKSLVDFWREFLPQVPQGLGPVTGQGVVFYYGRHDNTLGSSLVIDMSARISGGVYIKTSMNFDGTVVSAKTLPKITEDAFDLLTGNLGLTLE